MRQLRLFAPGGTTPKRVRLCFVDAAGFPTSHALFQGSWWADRQEIAYLRATGRMR